MVTYLSQLKSCGVFNKIKGILLGTFSKMAVGNCVPDIATLIQSFVGKDMPIAQINEIGHENNSKVIWIEREIAINNKFP